MGSNIRKSRAYGPLFIAAFLSILYSISCQIIIFEADVPVIRLFVALLLNPRVIPFILLGVMQALRVRDAGLFLSLGAVCLWTVPSLVNLMTGTGPMPLSTVIFVLMSCCAALLLLGMAVVCIMGQFLFSTPYDLAKKYWYLAGHLVLFARIAIECWALVTSYPIGLNTFTHVLLCLIDLFTAVSYWRTGAWVAYPHPEQVGH